MDRRNFLEVSMASLLASLPGDIFGSVDKPAVPVSDHFIDGVMDHILADIGYCRVVTSKQEVLVDYLPLEPLALPAQGGKARVVFKHPPVSFVIPEDNCEIRIEFTDANKDVIFTHYIQVANRRIFAAGYQAGSLDFDWS